MNWNVHNLLHFQHLSSLRWSTRRPHRAAPGMRRPRWNPLLSRLWRREPHWWPMPPCPPAPPTRSCRTPPRRIAQIPVWTIWEKTKVLNWRVSYAMESSRNHFETYLWMSRTNFSRRWIDVIASNCCTSWCPHPPLHPLRQTKEQGPQKLIFNFPTGFSFFFLKQNDNDIIHFLLVFPGFALGHLRDKVLMIFFFFCINTVHNFFSPYIVKLCSSSRTF